MRIPTVKIKHDHPRGYAIINKSAFDPEKHELYHEADTAPSGPVPEETPEPKPLAFGDYNAEGTGPTEDEMRAAIKDATGKAPHHKLGMDKLRDQYEALQK